MHCLTRCRLRSAKCGSSLVAVFLLLIISAVAFWSDVRYPYRISTFLANFGNSDTSHSDELFSRLDRNITANVYDIKRPYDNADFQCIRTVTKPSTLICLFDIWHDVFVSRTLQSAGVWEGYIINEFLEAVRRSDSEAGVLDIGANIGFYTLLSAKLDHRVVAVEPQIDAIHRIHRAAYVENIVDKITVAQNALAEIRTRATLREAGDNQGDARIELRVQECSGSCPTTIDTILLDDLVDIATFRQAVMKIDIQGYEHHAFQRASRLFREIDITHVFMEWEVMRDFYVSANHTSEDKQLVERMMRFLFRRNYRPYALVSMGGQALDPQDWGRWPIEVVWRRLPSSDVKSRLNNYHFKNWPR